MSILRVTVGSANAQSIASIEAAAARLATMQNQMSSGQRISKPSDDPTGTVRAMQLKGELARNTQYATNADDAQGWLSSTDTAYSQVQSVLQNARTLVVQGLNTGASDAAGNQAIASQLDGLRSTLLGLANTSYNGRPVFGGTTSGTQAYDTSGAYVGDSGSVTRAIAARTTVAINTSGPGVFGGDASGPSVFDVLQNLSGALAADPPTLASSALDQLDTALDRVSAAQATEGEVSQQVQRAQTTTTATGTALQTQLSDVTEVDVADLAVKVASANTSYQAALQTTAMVGQLSLLDFLR